MELVWNYKFHINENALEIKQCTCIHDHSSTMLPELGTVGLDVLSLVILTLHLLWRELIA